ncbi:MAG: cytochrome c3 family protein [Myxococcales bacterium]|nr:cytochrome c3 family protein [Myxococcales bacterium]MDH5306231.1 cytochrome c3 family protein [Myxococcales bacterium]MDH5567659.1 cytochrome c3 family protein [Myxococcales bacterium]
MIAILGNASGIVLGREARAGGWRRLAAAFAALLLGLPLGAGAASPATEDSCATCHSDPELLVTNKKLYEYYQQWQASIHKEEGVSCSDCHGGNPRSNDKTVAHGKGVASSDPDSGIYYQAIPETCGACHDDILEGFSKSNHFRHLVTKKQEKQGPTCVTCHGAINVDILTVNSVQESCARCHNETRGIHPEIPEKAHRLLNRFLSIHRFYRYISTNAEPEEAKAFFGEIDVKLRKLSVTWHTFDIAAVEQQTGDVLAVLKAKRDEIRQRRRAGTAEAEAAAAGDGGGRR